MIHYLPKKSHYGKSIVAHLPRVDKVGPFPCMEIRGHMSFPVRAQDAGHDQRCRYIEKDRWWNAPMRQTTGSSCRTGYNCTMNCLLMVCLEPSESMQPEWR